jgi:two-component system, NtrC family, response regulator AtoC
MRTPIRILLVEDDDVHRESLERHLARSGYEVMAVSSAERALGAFAAFRPALVLTDVRMPGMSGIDLLGRLRENTDVPVVVMTGFGDMASAIESMKNGAFEYLTKPLDLDELDDTLKRCFREHRRTPANEFPVEPGETAEAEEPTVESLVGRDPEMIAIYKTIGKVAATRTPVLIRGETGTGKELIARIIHHNAAESDEPFIAINCTAVPESLLESELFGHVRGSFTGAISDRRGRFELAGSGTLFLDEIGDTSMAFQAKLLRVLEEREFYPLGGETAKRTEARVIAATHRPVERMIREGTFREDLYFRLRVVEIRIPPLRERRDDIPLLTRTIAARVSRELSREVRVPDEVMNLLRMHDWPGNVRELENTITRAAVMARGPAITPDHITLGPATDDALEMTDDRSLRALERIHVQRVLIQAGRNKSRAAQILGISRPRLDRIISRHGLQV